MNPNNFYLCYLREISDAELQLVNAYWEFDGHIEVFKFKTSNSIFLEGKDVIKNISQNIGKLAFITSKKHFGCSSCSDVFQANSRSSFSQLLKMKPKKCSACVKKERNEVITKKLQSLEISTSEINHVTDPDTIEINYLNLFLILSISSNINRSTGLIKNLEHLNISGSAEIDNYLLDDLVAQNIIYKIEEKSIQNYQTIIDDLNYLYDNYRHLKPEDREKIDLLEARVPKLGYYLAKTNQFMNYEDFISFLYSEISKKTPNIEEIKLLEELINNILLQKAYQLIPFIESNHRIKIERNLSLENVLIKAVKSFSMRQVFSLIYYQGGEVAKVIHSNPSMQFFIKTKIFAKHVESRILYLEKNPDKEKYSRNLPKDMIDSKIEEFSSRYFLNDSMSWSDLSGEEILRNWIHNY